MGYIFEELIRKFAESNSGRTVARLAIIRRGHQTGSGSTRIDTSRSPGTSSR